jgi:hypothetical protein
MAPAPGRKPYLFSGQKFPRVAPSQRPGQLTLSTAGSAPQRLLTPERRTCATPCPRVAASIRGSAGPDSNRWLRGASERAMCDRLPQRVEYQSYLAHSPQCHCEKRRRRDEAIQAPVRSPWIASRSVSSGGHFGPGPLARNDGAPPARRAGVGPANDEDEQMFVGICSEASGRMARSSACKQQ